jgi:hypothetical protein
VHVPTDAPLRSDEDLGVGASTLPPEVFPRVLTVTWALVRPPASWTLRGRAVVSRRRARVVDAAGS